MMKNNKKHSKSEDVIKEGDVVEVETTAGGILVGELLEKRLLDKGSTIDYIYVAHQNRLAGSKIPSGVVKLFGSEIIGIKKYK